MFASHTVVVVDNIHEMWSHRNISARGYFDLLIKKIFYVSQTRFSHLGLTKIMKERRSEEETLAMISLCKLASKYLCESLLDAMVKMQGF